MKYLLLLLPLFSSLSFAAGFEKVTVHNLDFDYTASYGKGTVEKVGIGMSLVQEPYSVEVLKTEDAFELTSPYLDFTWSNPVPFIFDLERLETKKMSAALGAKTHFVESQYLMAQPKGRGEYKAFDVKGNCTGNAAGSFEVRLLEDCRNSMNLSVKKVDIPEDFILYKLVEELPLEELKEDLPGDHVIAKINKGDYFFQVYVKFWIYAGLRFWGHLQYENNHKVIAIRVDQIKFGYLPVTTIVMKKLKETIKNPDVKVDPPWIRINIGKAQ